MDFSVIPKTLFNPNSIFYTDVDFWSQEDRREKCWVLAQNQRGSRRALASTSCRECTLQARPIPDLVNLGSEPAAVNE